MSNTTVSTSAFDLNPSEQVSRLDSFIALRAKAMERLERRVKWRYIDLETIELAINNEDRLLEEARVRADRPAESPSDYLDRLLSRTTLNPETGCVEFGGRLSEKGYGEFDAARLGEVRAHRVVYTIMSGEPIPEDLVVNHKCFNRRCVNFDHLELTTQRYNSQYLSGASKRSTTGVRNVSRKGNTYCIDITANGQRYKRSGYKTLEAADLAARQLRAILFHIDEAPRDNAA